MYILLNVSYYNTKKYERFKIPRQSNKNCKTLDEFGSSRFLGRRRVAYYEFSTSYTHFIS